MEHLRHDSPSGKKDEHGIITEEGRMHNLNFYIHGSQEGIAQLTYYSRPVKFYCLEWIKIEDDLQGSGYGKKLMAKVESFLKERKACAILHDLVGDPELSARLYEKRGWKVLSIDTEDPDSPWRGFNLPDAISDKTLAEMARRTSKAQKVRKIKLAALQEVKK